MAADPAEMPLDGEPPAFAVRSLGCRVNQYESRALAGALAGAGWRETDAAAASHVIVNVCAVTEKGSRKARRLVRFLCRAAPRRRVYVMGCATAHDRAAYLALPQVRAVVPPPARDAMARIIAGCAGGDALRSFGARTRAYVKIQDGCSRACTYCIVPLLRGPSRSRPAGDVAAECRALLAGGAPEIWIAGTHLDEWAGGLPALLDSIGPLFDGVSARARLGSIGIEALTEPLLAAAARHAGICRHFHISLQSGSARIRRRMGRRCGPDEIRARIARCREALPGATFTGDILVGFPGEEEEDFAATAALCREIGFVKMHVFPFSPRPGTPAAGFSGRPAAAETASRCARLAALERELFALQAGALVGRTLAVVVERAGAAAEGFSEEYVRVRFAPGAVRKGAIARVRAADLRPGFLWGEIVA
ncbi:MAG TPA: hypothetical protein DCM87_00205 [Planctomycetes bacterium]|nr:hypothetical protein [Planctomycetota bacterium]